MLMKKSVNGVPPPSVVLASPGAERSEAERSDAERSVAPGEAKTMPDPEVVVRAKRRQYSAEYKKRILAEADSAKAPGAMGAMLRREGLYSSHLTHWRQQRDRGLAPRQRGPQSKRDPLFDEVRKLKQENGHLTQRLARAEIIIDVQKKSLVAVGDSSGDGRQRREQTMNAAVQAVPALGPVAACEALGVSRASLHRLRNPPPALAERRGRPSPPRALRSRSAPSCSGTCTRSAFKTVPRPRSTARCWTKASTAARSAPYTPSWRRKGRAANAATNSSILPTKNRSCWPPLPISSGVGTSPSCWAPPSGPTSTSM